MKAIKSREDIKALQKVGYPEHYIAFIDDYYSRLISVYGADYKPDEEGYIIMLEEGDPITDKQFLETKLCLRGGEDLVSVIKEFVDHDIKEEIFTILVVYSSDFAMSYMVPDREDWFGQQLINQLQSFQN